MKTMAGGPFSLVRHMLCVKRAPERYPFAYAHIDVSSPFIVKTLRAQVHRMDYASHSGVASSMYRVPYGIRLQRALFAWPRRQTPE